MATQLCYGDNLVQTGAHVRRRELLEYSPLKRSCIINSVVLKVKTEDLPESGTSQKAAIMVPKAQKKGVTFASKELHSNMEVKSKNIKKTKKNVNKKAKGSNIKSGLSKKNGFAMSEVTKGKGKKKHHTEYDEIEDATESVDSLDSGFVADNNSDTSLSSVNWLKVESDYLGESQHVSDILDWHPDVLPSHRPADDDEEDEDLELESIKKDAKKGKKFKDVASKKSSEAKVEKKEKTEKKKSIETEDVEDDNLEEVREAKKEETEVESHEAKAGKSSQKERWYEVEPKPKKKIKEKANTVVELENLKEDYQEKLAIIREKRKKGKVTFLEERQEKKLKKKLVVIERRKAKLAKKKKTFRADLNQLEDMKKKTKEERKAEMKARRGYYNWKGKLVYSKFDFSEHTPLLEGVETTLRPDNLKAMLAKTLKEKEKRKVLEQKGAGDVAARRMEEAAWSSAMQKAEGKKVRDNVDLLKKSIKLKEKQKKTSTKKWEHRKEMVQRRQEEKQARRKRNIKAQKEKRLNKKMEKMKTKGHIVPGF
ncbi:surfeit locus protein 6 homolog [Penaeus japonicus]|uniref:surfeit locus protein 6 homolog n=1 Tax=Penaeus japonicus TaxID=27405 RepID=UPI001C71492F|nr:surfeit locus protein 6 homolog [Penaeus japonicus]